MVLTLACQSPRARAAAQQSKHIVFVAGTPSHGQGAHEHRAGCMLLADALTRGMPGYRATVTTEGWPENESIFNDADAVVFYCDGGGGHYANRHLESFDTVMRRGVGLACLHYGVEVPKGPSGEKFIDWIGGYFEPHWSVNPHWTAEYAALPDHDISRGVQPFKIHDEWYYHMRFRDGMKGVTPILTAVPPADTLNRGDGAHSGNPHVRTAVLERKEPQHMAWAYQRGADYGNGRGFGFTGGHFHKNWQNDDFRKLVLNAIVWCAKGAVPNRGVLSPTPSEKQLLAHQDVHGNLGARAFTYPTPGHPTSDASPAVNKGSATSTPKFQSPLVTSQTPGHAVLADVDVTGAKQVHLVVTDGGNGFNCDWADWAEPRFVDAQGKETRLTDVTWKKASAGWGNVNVNKNAGGQPMSINGNPVEYGVGVHAWSLLVYDVPPGTRRFKARCGLDNGGTDQAGGGASSVQFLVFTETPPASFLANINANGGGGGGNNRGGLAPEDSLQALTVGDGLQASLFAQEPMLLSPSSTDIDHKGRVWVCEIVNYRSHRNDRQEGDRILILEDSDGDGQADRQKVFYQGRDIDSPHGVCVLGTPDGRNTRVIVSAGDHVWLFTDEDGDDKPDRKEAMFTGISGAQHDHGIHAFLFGPDGKLYFNFGNAGKQLKDKDGNPVIDAAGNEVNDRRNPYQEGMVFRCDLDGSNLETLGWNFRNNWMVTVDSFGTIWQSDNDDDGHRGVRINYVMEFGNHGYRDEKTGAGWQDKRTNMETEIPLRHWHLNDPGVVPNILQTGAGSPTGIMVYEGDLLPEAYRNQVIHTDAGPNVCRAYPVTPDGAGYAADTLNVLTGDKDRWFRPADVKAAPDGSLIVADWYDPGVGGHAMRDMDRGRLFRITPSDHSTQYNVPTFDFATPKGAVAALKSPTPSVRYMAWQALHGWGADAESALLSLWQSNHPRYRARALWLLGKIHGQGQHYVDAAVADKDSDIRIVGLRLARQLQTVDTRKVVARLVKDPSPQVRRECALALRFDGSPEADQLWAQLAVQHDGKDRWYLEALGIGSDLHASSRLNAYLTKIGNDWNTPAGRDVIWRSRSNKAPALLAKFITSPDTGKEERDRYMRALDFHDGEEKEAALLTILGL